MYILPLIAAVGAKSDILKANRDCIEDLAYYLRRPQGRIVMSSLIPYSPFV